MYSLKSYSVKILIVIMAIASVITVSGVYVSTPRDTSPNPSFYEYVDVDPGTPVYENDNFKYYLNDETDVITVYDIRNGYQWKTGLDIPFTTDMRKECKTFSRTWERQFSGVPLDDDTFDQYDMISSSVSEYVDAELLTYYGVLEFDTDGLASTYDNEGTPVPAAKEDIQLVFEDLALEAGKTYQISFYIEMDVARDYEVALGSEFVEVVTSEISDDLVLVTLMHTQTASETGDLVFNFGYFASNTVFETDIKLDDVKVEEYTTEVVVDSDVVGVGHFDVAEDKYEISVDELLEVCQPAEERMNEYFTAFANSLVSFEYYDQTNTLIYASSAAKDDETKEQVVESTFMRENGDDSTWILDISFASKQFTIQAKVHIKFTESGIEYDIYNDEITGPGRENLASVIIAPWQGASGGAYKEFDYTDPYDTGYAGTITFKDEIPGYVMIPDGAGALIRFNDYNVKLDKLRVNAYGSNPTQEYHYITYDDFWIPFKNLSMPLFGIAHGDNQAGFIAYATEGDAYMGVEVWPEEHITYYTNAFARFEYNSLYFQVYNKAGDGNTQLQEKPNDFDIHMVYEYLDGTSTEGERADYVGMAMKYREYLFGGETKQFDYTDIPIRLDFVMSDSEKSLVGYVNQVTTTAEGVERILDDVVAKGITNINSGLLGWNDGGITFGDPRDADYAREIGTKRDFKGLITEFNKQGIDISLSQNYFLFNEEIMRYRGNAATHTSSWYAEKFIFDYNLDVDAMYYARPVKSTKWMFDQMSEMNEVGVKSYTITGITDNLVSDFSNDMLRHDSLNHFVTEFGKIDSNKMVNAYQPNQYLLPFVDRYLQTPVYNTQYLIETDTVPFLQLVLQGYMELYAPYSNFSFYTDSDVLRMIDYNVYPSFALTEEPAHLLTDTFSNYFYSTEYSLYDELIQSTYNTVNDALSNVINTEWVGREVYMPGVIINTYSDGTEIVINYTDDPVDYRFETVEPVSYRVY